MTPLRPRRAFTLLEVLIALGILAVGMAVLVNSQATAVVMTADGVHTSVATRLAQEKLEEVLLTLEEQGWTDQDIEEDGDFSDFGDEEFRGESLHLDEGEALKDFHWAYTVRQIDLTLPSDLGGVADELISNGYAGEDKAAEYAENATDENSLQSQLPDLSTLGISPDMVADYLSNFIREVRVRVWWGDNEDGTDQVEIVTHAINPTGVVYSSGDGTDTAKGATSSSGSQP